MIHERLGAADLKRVMQRYLDRLRTHRDDLNRLNVYPVPDGDTGTNMALTVESVVAALQPTEGMEELLVAIARGALMGAQGNSGIILSQILGGLADAFRGTDDVGTAHVVDALDRASVGAYRAVGRPVEGTILTVLREAAEAAAEANTPEGESLAALLRRVYDRAESALERTPDLLPVLKQAGVVDAGGAGFLLLLAAFLEEVTGEDVIVSDAIFRVAQAPAVSKEIAVERTELDVAGLRYEVMFLLSSADEGAGDALRSAWSGVGDSIVVVGSGGTWNCHIHTDDIGAAIEAGIAAGTPSRIKVTDLLEQAAGEAVRRGRQAPDPVVVFDVARDPAPDVAVIAVASGEGVVSWFRDAGAAAVVVGGQTMNPSVGDLLRAVEMVASDAVILLPNNRNVVAAAGQVGALTAKQVEVVPTTSVPQGLAAMVALPPGSPPAEAAAAMGDAAGVVVTAEITRAVRDAITPVGRIAEGDWLGVVDGDVRCAGPGLSELAAEVLELMVGADAELVTVIVGSGEEPEATAAIVGHARAAGLEVDLVSGGQPLYPYLIGVE